MTDGARDMLWLKTSDKSTEYMLASPKHNLMKHDALYRVNLVQHQLSKVRNTHLERGEMSTVQTLDPILTRREIMNRPRQ